MAKITFKRNQCKAHYETMSGPVPCGQGALRGKDYCSRHRPTNRVVSAGTGTQHLASDSKTLCGRTVEYEVSGAFSPKIDCQRCYSLSQRTATSGKVSERRQYHNFDATGEEESNEPLICSFCGLDIENDIHKARAVLSIDGSHACALLGENVQDGESEFVEIVYPDGKNASDAYKHERTHAFRALHRLRERLGINMTYALGAGL